MVPQRGPIVGRCHLHSTSTQNRPHIINVTNEWCCMHNQCPCNISKAESTLEETISKPWDYCCICGCCRHVGLCAPPTWNSVYGVLSWLQWLCLEPTGLKQFLSRYGRWCIRQHTCSGRFGLHIHIVSILAHVPTW